MTSTKHDFANYDQFASDFDTAYKTIQRVSVPNLKLFGSIKIELAAKEAGEKWAGGILWPTNMAAAIQM